MRGTTPKIKFRLPFDSYVVAKAKVSFKYAGKVLLLKHTADLDMQDDIVEVRLSREETLLFPDDQNIKVQLEIETADREALKTKVYTVHASELLDEGGLL